MKILTISSKVWWLAKADELRPKKGAPIVDWVRRVVEAFRFAQAPVALPPPTEGMPFKEGAISTPDGVAAIRELTLYNDGLSVEMHSSSDDALIAVSAILTLLSELGMNEPITPPRFVFQSMLTFETESDLNRLAALYDPISAAIKQATGSELPHLLRTIEYTVDPKVAPPFGSKVFRLERRNDEPYAAGRWFSFANATTQAHIELLGTVENLAKGHRPN